MKMLFDKITGLGYDGVVGLEYMPVEEEAASLERSRDILMGVAL